ncbi:MAG: type III-A CRISPR-associated RAMP protein Csm5 [Thermoplasmata archaeon]
MRLEIEIKTPTVVTSGEYLINLILYRKGGSLFRLSIDKLFYDILNKENNRNFIENFKNKLSGNVVGIKDLYSNISVKDEYLVWPEIKKFPEKFMENRQQVLDYIGYFYRKDDRDYYLPYLPGSTIKGAIRNALISKILRENPAGDVKKIEKDSFTLYFTNDNERVIFQLRDIFRFVQISDFRVKNINELSMGIGLVKRVNFINNSEKIPSYTFYLLPGTLFEGDISISIDLKLYIKNRYNKLNRNSKLIKELVFNNYNNGELNADEMIKYLLKSLNDFSNNVARSQEYGLIFKDISLSNGQNGRYDAFIGRFKGKYLNLPRLPKNLKTYPIIFTGDGKKYKMGHVNFIMRL